MGVFLLVELGNRLRVLREERRLTQKQVAAQIGVTASNISAYENGIRYPSFAALIKLAQLYKVSTDYLLGITGKRTAEAQYTISLDGLKPSRIALVEQLIKALKE